MGTVGWHADVGNELISGVPEPHGLDVARDDVRRLMPFCEIVVLDCGADCVGESFRKYLKEFRILLISQVLFCFCRFARSR